MSVEIIENACCCSAGCETTFSCFTEGCCAEELSWCNIIASLSTEDCPVLDGIDIGTDGDPTTCNFAFSINSATVPGWACGSVDISLFCSGSAWFCSVSGWGPPRTLISSSCDPLEIIFDLNIADPDPSGCCGSGGTLRITFTATAA